MRIGEKIPQRRRAEVIALMSGERAGPPPGMVPEIERIFADELRLRECRAHETTVDLQGRPLWVYRIDVPSLKQEVTRHGFIGGHYVVVGEFRDWKDVTTFLSRVSSLLRRNYEIHILSTGGIRPEESSAWADLVERKWWPGVTVISAASGTYVRIGRRSQINVDPLLKLSELLRGAGVERPSVQPSGQLSDRKLLADRLRSMLRSIEDELDRVRLSFALGEVGRAEFKAKESELEGKMKAIVNMLEFLKSGDSTSLRELREEVAERLRVLEDLRAKGKVSQELYEGTSSLLKAKLEIIDDILSSRASENETRIYGE